MDNIRLPRCEMWMRKPMRAEDDFSLTADKVKLVSVVKNLCVPRLDTA